MARWDGSSWHPFGSGALGPPRLVTTPSGDVFAAGGFSTATGNAQYVRGNGAAWTALPPGGPVGMFPLGPVGADGVLFRTQTGLWVQRPTGWSNLVAWSGGADVRGALVRANGDVIVGGAFTMFDGQVALRVAHWNGSQWQATCVGSGGSVTAAAAALDGSVLVGGTFRQLGGLVVDRVARFDGTGWSSLGFSAGAVTHVLARPNGEALFAGTFPTPIGGIHRLLRWQNGAAVPIPLSASQFPRAMALAADGTAWVSVLDANLQSGVLRWDGTALVPSALVVNGQIDQIVEMPNGELILGGAFVTSAGNGSLLRWDGQQASSIPGAPAASDLQLARATNGDLLLGGSFTGPGQRVARWDGTAWKWLGATLTGVITSIESLPNGDVVVGERLPGGSVNTFMTRIQRWDGAQWSVVGIARGTAKVLWSHAGELVLFGDLVEVDGTVSAMFARLTSACAAAVVDRGGGCAGSAGPVQLRVDQRAWLGGTARVATLGVPANAFAIGVLGTTPVAIPLGTLDPLGGAGCELRAAPGVLALLPIVTGEARATLFVPNAPTLLGASFEQQTIVLETDAVGAISAWTASNALGHTIGAW